MQLKSIWDKMAKRYTIADLLVALLKIVCWKSLLLLAPVFLHCFAAVFHWVSPYNYRRALHRLFTYLRATSWWAASIQLFICNLFYSKHVDVFFYSLKIGSRGWISSPLCSIWWVVDVAGRGEITCIRIPAAVSLPINGDVCSSSIPLCKSSVGVPSFQVCWRLTFVLLYILPWPRSYSSNQ